MLDPWEQSHLTLITWEPEAHSTSRWKCKRLTRNLPQSHSSKWASAIQACSFCPSLSVLSPPVPRWGQLLTCSPKFSLLESSHWKIFPSHEKGNDDLEYMREEKAHQYGPLSISILLQTHWPHHIRLNPTKKELIISALTSESEGANQLTC